MHSAITLIDPCAGQAFDKSGGVGRAKQGPALEDRARLARHGRGHARPSGGDDGLEQVGGRAHAWAPDFRFDTSISCSSTFRADAVVNRRSGRGNAVLHRAGLAGDEQRRTGVQEHDVAGATLLAAQNRA